MHRKVRLVAVLLVLALLASGAAQAMPLSGGPSPASESGGILARVWEWIASLFRIDGSSGGDYKSIWEGEGSQADPNG